MLAPLAVALLVSLERSQDGHRVHTRPADPVAVLQLADHLAGGVRHRDDQADPGHGREVADHRRERHLLEERRPDLRARAELGRNRLPRQLVLSDEPGCLDCRGRLLQLLESLDLPQRLAVGRHDAVDDPGVELLVRRARRLRVAQAKQVGVGPTLPLAVLDRLVGELAHVLALVPTGHRASGGAAPAAEGLHCLSELEKVSAGARHVRDCGKRSLPGRLFTELGRHR